MTLETKEIYRLLFENSKDVIFVTTPDGRYLDINPAGVEFYGYESREEMLGLDIGNDIYADPAERSLFRRKLEEDGFVKDLRIVVKRKDGRELIVLATAHAVRNEKGDIVAYQGINHDITEREREREEFRESLERLDMALQSAEFGVWSWDVVSRKIHFDAQSFRILGIDPAAFTGSVDDFYKVVLPEDRVKVRGNLYRSFRGEGLIGHEYRVVRPDGSIRYVTGRWKIIKDPEGRPLRLHGSNGTSPTARMPRRR